MMASYTAAQIILYIQKWLFYVFILYFYYLIDRIDKFMYLYDSMSFEKTQK